jgi:hypothetical protein
MKTILRLKSNLEEGPINEMFYAIDTNMNGTSNNMKVCYLLTSIGNFCWLMAGRNRRKQSAFRKAQHRSL